MRGVEQLQVKRLQNILAPNGACLLLLKKDQWILKYLVWYAERHYTECHFAECDCSLFSGFVAFPFFSKFSKQLHKFFFVEKQFSWQLNSTSTWPILQTFLQMLLMEMHLFEFPYKIEGATEKVYKYCPQVL